MMNTKVKAGVIAAVILFLALASYVYFAPIVQKNREEASFIQVKEVQLTEQNRQFHQEQINKADNALVTASTNDEKINAHMTRGFNLQALGKLNEAKLAFEAASKLDPNDFSPHKAIFEVKAEMTDFEGARESARKAIELGPHMADTWIRYIEFEQGKMSLPADKIGFLYIEALDKTKNHPDIITSYAMHLESVGNLQSAKEYWMKAKEINPPNAKLYDGEIKRLDALMSQQQ